MTYILNRFVSKHPHFILITSAPWPSAITKQAINPVIRAWLAEWGMPQGQDDVFLLSPSGLSQSPWTFFLFMFFPLISVKVHCDFFPGTQKCIHLYITQNHTHTHHSLLLTVLLLLTWAWSFSFSWMTSSARALRLCSSSCQKRHSLCLFCHGKNTTNC